jgi:hypothetical protein
MKDKQVIAMWTSAVVQDYALRNAIDDNAIPAYVEKYRLIPFLIDNYELFHLYPDEAVFDEIDKEIEASTNA